MDTVSYTHLDVYKRQEEKEATSAEDMEEILLAIEDRQSEPAEEVQQPEGEPEATQQETQPEVNQPVVKIPEAPTQTEEAAFQEWLKQMMESLNKEIEDGQKKMDENSLSTNPVSYTHLDVYKRQVGRCRHRSPC